jgi:hypothetical protein
VKSPTGEKYAQPELLSNSAVHALNGMIHPVIAIGISPISLEREIPGAGGNN